MEYFDQLETRLLADRREAASALAAARGEQDRLAAAFDLERRETQQRLRIAEDRNAAGEAVPPEHPPAGSAGDAVGIAPEQGEEQQDPVPPARADATAARCGGHDCTSEADRMHHENEMLCLAAASAESEAAHARIRIDALEGALERVNKTNLDLTSRLVEAERKSDRSEARRADRMPDHARDTDRRASAHSNPDVERRLEVLREVLLRNRRRWALLPRAIWCQWASAALTTLSSFPSAKKADTAVGLAGQVATAPPWGITGAGGERSDRDGGTSGVSFPLPD